MLDLINKLVLLNTTKNNYNNINDAINLCIDYFNDCKNIFIKKDIINGNLSILFSNYQEFNFDVLSICHIDVVPMQNNNYKLIKDNNIIYGRGVFDMKSFIVSALYNLKQIIKQQLNIKYGILIVSNEETAYESDVKYWINKLNTKVVLDADNGCGNIDSIIKENLGAITIKLSKKDKNTINLIKNNFNKFYCNIINDEIDILFNNTNIEQDLLNCMKNDTTYSIIMLNKYIENDLNNKYHILYKNILENEINKKVKYIISKNTTDSRFFSYKNITVIGNQANGGNYHKLNEWLDYNSLLQFNKIQFEFLSRFNYI